MKRKSFFPSMVQAITVLTVLKMMTKAQTTCNQGMGRVMYERLPNQQLQGFDDDVVRDTAPPFRVLEKCEDLCLRDRTAANNIVRACSSFDFQPGSRIASFSGTPEYEESTCYLTREQAAPEGIGQLMLVPNSVHFTEVCLTSNRPERECPMRRYVFERHPRKKLKLPAADLKEMTAANRTECEDRCLNEFSFVCRSATYDAALRSCSLSRFTRRTHPELLEDDPNSDYLENTCLNAERRCDGLAVFIKEENKRLGGPFEVDLFTNMTLEECQGMCIRAEKYFCRSIEFDDMTKQCVISEEDSVSQKDDLGISSSPTNNFYDLVCLDNPRGSEYPDNSVTSHLFSNGRRPDTAFQRYRNSRLTGEFHSEITGRSLSECLDECLRQTSFQCRSAVYSDRFRTCRLSRFNQREGMRVIYDADYDYYENLMHHLMMGIDGEGNTASGRPDPVGPDNTRPPFSSGGGGGSPPWHGGPGGPGNDPYGDRNRPPTGPDRYPDRYPSRFPTWYPPGNDPYDRYPGSKYPPSGSRYPDSRYPPPPIDRYPPSGGRYPPSGGGRYPPSDDRYPAPAYPPSGGGRYPPPPPIDAGYPPARAPYPPRDPGYPPRKYPIGGRPPYDDRLPPSDLDRYPAPPGRYPIGGRPPIHDRLPPNAIDRYPPGDDRYYPGDRYGPGDDRYIRGRYPVGGDRYPAGGDRYPPAGDRYPPGGDRYPPAIDRYPAGGDRYPPPVDRYPSAGPGYPSGGGGGGGGGDRYPIGGDRYPIGGDRYPPSGGDRYPPGDRYGPAAPGERYPPSRWGYGRPTGYDEYGGGRPPAYDGFGPDPGFGPVGPSRPYSSRCDDGDNFKQIGARQRVRRQYVRRFTTVASLLLCQRECTEARDFICRSFNYRDNTGGPYDGGIERDNCELSDRDTRDLDLSNPAFFDSAGSFDFYERSTSRNSVDGECLDVSQECNEDGMTFTLRTPEGFVGRIYTYGFYDRCFFRGNGGTVNILRISGAQGYPECGTQRYGDTMTNIVVVQFSDYVQTGKDKRFNLTCLFRGPGEAVVTSGYIGAGSGSPIPIEYLPAENSLSSKVRLMILYQGRPTTTIAVGDPLTFRLEAQDGYNYVTDIFATNVIARDPYSGRSVQLIDRYGCPVDSYVFPELDRLRDGDSLEARFNAFKIPESNFLVFEATVRTCREGCQPAYCTSNTGRSEPSFGRRRRRRSINGTVSDEENLIEGNSTVINGTIVESGDGSGSNDTAEMDFEDNTDLMEPAEYPEHVREMIEVFDSREELQMEARKVIALPETVCLTSSEYHGFISAILILLILLMTVTLVSGWAYRRYWTVMGKNLVADRHSPAMSSVYPPANNRSNNMSLFGAGLQKPFAASGLGRVCDFGRPEPSASPGVGAFDDPSEPIYTDPSLFERSRSLRSISVSQGGQRQHSAERI